ncbi:carboxylesterase/lipase family protein [Geodermatophilus sp. URMC 61]|uniref:carboxylesterase/lipase family protein n=1 Tax=Geodermatophilus sp. URMC 61 TaxID=3423411 RepID=UPI00406C9A19
MRPSLPRPLGRALLSLGLGAALVAGGGPALAAPGAAPDGEPPLVVHTEDGAVRGALAEDHRLFQGIPFAAPPVGDLRFRPPAPVEPWDGVRGATAPGSPCPQLQDEFNPFASTDEDCLSLNVTTPAGLEGRSGDLPVMVWIHGGGFVGGAGWPFDARRLAVDGDVVVVTINYRLGPLGFLAQRDLSAQNGDLASGSAALLDQQAALRWVERNIAAFGGDPRTVTVFGESAGGSSVCVQLASPTARGLFDRAIAQSFSCTARYDDLATAEATGDQVAAAVGCAGGTDVAACLRQVGVEELLRAWPGDAFVVGGSALPVQPADAFAAGERARVPVVHGNTRDENTLFTPLLPLVSTGAPPSSSLTAEEYAAELTARYGDRAGEVLARYPADAYPSPLRALAAVDSDAGTPTMLSICAHVDAHEALSAVPGSTPVYAYQFRDRTASPLIDFPFPGYPGDAQHGTELPYLFPGLFGAPLTPEQQELSATMVRYWTTFAATGDPNGRGTPGWHRYRDSGDVQGLDLASAGGIGPVDVAAESHCAFWASLAGA